MTSRGLHVALRTLVLILTFAMATSGFAHRLSSPSDVQSEVYAATYGLTAADLCGGSEDGGKGGGCAACRLLAAFHLAPADIGPVRLTLVPMAASPAVPRRRLASLTFDVARPARAPPVV